MLRWRQSPELALRSLLRRAGLRYRCDLRLSLPECVLRPYVVFTRRRIAVFVDGCFWLQCPLPGRRRSEDQAPWSPRETSGMPRPSRNARWLVLRFWEHEGPSITACRAVTAFQALD
ncbi:very short patch repair endonuclease [Microbacterium lacusdiani]